ncbi:hypothetical protein JTB14_036928 [Gonioctena quinquepunctata]|nr:hypothetical protein JTB14_036928 [Gonioctena quinquepunctata]
MLAKKRILLNVKISGCKFHFYQCLWRKILSIGLVEGYGNDEPIKLHIRMCAFLAFPPVNDVVDGWLGIMENAPNGTKIDLINELFVNNCLDNPSVPINIWNVHNQRHRTTNSVEGRRNLLNRLDNKPEPNILGISYPNDMT